MPQDISRRNFLRGGLAAAAGVAASGVILPQAVLAAGGGELCTVLDLSKCIGCEACVDACRDQWQATVPDPVNPMPQPFPARVPLQDWSKKKDVSDRLTPYNFLYVEHLDLEYKGQEIEMHVPRRCMHCDSAPCVNLCPFGASRVEKNGVVHIDPEICMGGAKCKKVCPWHIPQRQSGVGIYLDILPEYAGNGVMFKCHRCLPLLEKGENPRCIAECPEDVQAIGPRREMLARTEKLAREKAQADGVSPEHWRDYVYGLGENGGTSTFYVSQVPFAKVSAAIAALHQEQTPESQVQAAGRGRGKRAAGKRGGKSKRRGFMGRPPMGPVADTMASAENLSKALLLAPVIGLAAGFTKLFGKKPPSPGPKQEGGQS